MSNKYLDIAMQKVIKQEVNKVLDDIKAEIKMEITASWYKGKHAGYRDGLDKALEIIDRHIGGNE